jgi:hypothetical protein
MSDDLTGPEALNKIAAIRKCLEDWSFQAPEVRPSDYKILDFIWHVVFSDE